MGAPVPQFPPNAYAYTRHPWPSPASLRGPQRSPALPCSSRPSLQSCFWAPTPLGPAPHGAVRSPALPQSLYLPRGREVAPRPGPRAGSHRPGPSFPFIPPLPYPPREASRARGFARGKEKKQEGAEPRRAVPFAQTGPGVTRSLRCRSRVDTWGLWAPGPGALGVAGNPQKESGEDCSLDAFSPPRKNPLSGPRVGCATRSANHGFPSAEPSFLRI
ncbi:PREDICTED: translation initiation factor IF-2-like [Chinchilla lanigera]|uniref:translation initiation factor IF-2-like n=1 Tax=Chinchilla lanigera TaxID=34839 RepID=UPI00069602E8|nr:PREDICTED: translation initiation factor IF-2-like [Chinchilla lanigera]